MINQILRIFKKEYPTLNRIEIWQENLLHNYKYLSSIDRKVKIAPVLKSNAYGHGLAIVAKILDHVGAPFFCVDSLYEAYELLKAQIKTPILIMGYTDPQNFKVKKLPFSYAFFDLELAKILNEYQKGRKVHLFVDTGMHREGVPINELPHFLEEIKKLPNIKIEGLMSHLSSADDKKDPLNRLQVKNFKKALEICKNYRLNLKWVHIANSDGLQNFHDQLKFTNMARIGLALYGISSDPNLKPVLQLKSRVIQIKKLKKGDQVGYGGTFAAKKPMTLGVLPLGYYDGVDRRLSNKGFVSVHGIICPIIGKVSMNMTTIDLLNIPHAYVGQEVVVYSNNPKGKNSIENAAKICKSIPYVILVHLPSSTKRIVV